MMKKTGRIVCVIGILLMAAGVLACGQPLAQEKGGGVTESRLVSLGEYKNLDYTDTGGREPTDDEVEEEMKAILAWFEGAELTDESVRENLDFDSVESFREDTRRNLKEVYEERNRKAAAAELMEKVIEASRFEIAQKDVDGEYSRFFGEYKSAAEAGKMTVEQYAREWMNMSEAKLKETCREAAEKIVRVRLVTEAILDKEGIDAEAEYEKTGSLLAEENGFESLAEFEEGAGGADAVLEEVKYRLAADFLISQGVPQKGKG